MKSTTLLSEQPLNRTMSLNEWNFLKYSIKEACLNRVAEFDVIRRLSDTEDSFAGIVKNREGEVFNINEDNLDMFYELMVEHDLVIQQDFANDKLRVKLKNINEILNNLGIE